MKVTKKLRRLGLVALCLLSFSLNCFWHGIAPARSQPPSQSAPPQAATASPSSPAPATLSQEQLVAALDNNPSLLKLATADQLFKQQEFATAEKLYREAKPAFNLERPIKPPTLIFDPARLDGGASVYWKQAQEGIKTNLESKIFIPLQLLTENYPEFIPGHIELARVCQQNPEGCKRAAKEGQPDNAIAVLERASFLYLDQTDLLDARIATFGQEERWLEASIAARQFALTFPQHAQASKYAELAKVNFKRYEEVVNQKLSGNVVAISLLSMLTGDKSGADLVRLLLQGEAKVGQEMADVRKKELTEKNQIVTDPAVVEVVNRVGTSLAKTMGRDDFTYEFTVFRDETMNAFALPGGKVFISTGLLANLKSEAELAGVLGHEIAHSVLSHGFQKLAETAILANFSKIIPGGDIIKDAAGASSSQAQERQADILGTRALANAEYAADGLRNVLVLFQQRDRDTTPDWLRSHPAPKERIRYVEDLILRNGFNRYAYEGVVSLAVANKSLKGLPAVTTNDIATQPLQPGQNALAKPSPSQPPTSEATPEATPEVKPETTPGAVKPTSTEPILVARLEQKLVNIQLSNVKVERNGSYTFEMTIDNQSDRPVIIVRNFIKVLNLDNEEVTIKATLEKGADAGIAPGSTLKGTIQVMDKDHRWKQTPSQDLTLLVKESSSGARVFRIPF